MPSARADILGGSPAPAGRLHRKGSRMDDHSWVDVSDDSEAEREWECDVCGRRVGSTTDMVAADREGCGSEDEGEAEEN